MTRKRLIFGVLVLFSMGVALAQYRREGGGRRFWGGNGGPMVQTEGGQLVNEDTVRTARETAPQVTSAAVWTNVPGFEKDVFTFARLLFKSPGMPALMGWLNDYPDSDLNLSYRLQELTSIRSDPDGRVVRLTEPALFDYPFIFAAKPGGMELSEEETGLLRKYVLNGGAFVVDDMWGERDWESFEEQMKRVLPGRGWTELDIKHPLFHCVFDLKGTMNDLQSPSIHFWQRNYDPSKPNMHVSARRGAMSDDMHVRAWLDERQRIMILALHNCDNGDGWEREGQNEEYFHLFS